MSTENSLTCVSKKFKPEYTLKYGGSVCVCVCCFARHITVKCKILTQSLSYEVKSSLYAARFCYNIEKMCLPNACLVRETAKNKNHWRTDVNLNFSSICYREKKCKFTTKNKQRNKQTHIQYKQFHMPYIIRQMRKQ